MKLDNRLWVLVTVIICGALLAGGWFLGVEPQLAATAAANEQRSSARGQIDQLRSEIARLEAAKKNEGALSDKLASLKKAVPPGIEGSAFLAQVDRLVGSSGVSLKSVVLGQAVPYVAPESTKPAARSADAGGSSGTEDAPAAATNIGPKTIAPLTDPLITGANFITLPVDMTVTGSSDQVATFLSGVQRTERLVLVSKVDRKTDETGVTSLTLRGTMYVLRDPSDPAGATTTATSAAANG